MNIFSAFINLFYPQLCHGCGEDPIGSGQFLCFRCHADLPFTHYENHRQNKTEVNFYGRVKIESAMSLLYFSKNMIVQNMMHEFKYQGQQELGLFLGRLLGRALIASPAFTTIDEIVPLPLSARKQKMRGYNQAELLCDGIGEIMGKPVSTQNVIRFRDTDTQTKKHRRERWENVEGIFAVREPELLRGKHLLLVDDVITTGATLEACAQVILRVEDTKLSIATLATATR